MREIRNAKSIFFSRVRSTGSGSRSIAGSFVVVLIISLRALLVGIIS